MAAAAPPFSCALLSGEALARAETLMRRFPPMSNRSEDGGTHTLHTVAPNVLVLSLGSTDEDRRVVWWFVEPWSATRQEPTETELLARIEDLVLRIAGKPPRFAVFNSCADVRTLPPAILGGGKSVPWPSCPWGACHLLRWFLDDRYNYLLHTAREDGVLTVDVSGPADALTAVWQGLSAAVRPEGEGDTLRLVARCAADEPMAAARAVIDEFVAAVAKDGVGRGLVLSSIGTWRPDATSAGVPAHRHADIA